MALRLAFTQSLPLARLSFRRAITPLPSRLSDVQLPLTNPLHNTPFFHMSTSPTPPPPTRTTTPSTAPTPPRSSPSTPQTFPITLLYDGDCPLCLKEISFLRNRQSRLNLSNLHFTDIANPQYDPSKHANIDYQTAMGVIHAITADGQVITGVPVFRLAYEAVGLGWVYAITKLKPIGWVVEKLYDFWADKRLAWTGRGDMQAIMDLRRDKIEQGCKRTQ